MSTPDIEPRPKVVSGTTTRVRLTCGNLYITVTRNKGKMFEVFAVLGKSGWCSSSVMSALAVSITIAMRSGTAPELLIKHLKGIKCNERSWEGGVEYFSCTDAIAKVMEKELTRIKEGFYADERPIPENSEPKQDTEESDEIPGAERGVPQ